VSSHVTRSSGEDSGDGGPGKAESKLDFAARLRELRAQAGSPSFRHLARLTNYSSSTLADATSGKRLPTEAVLKAFVAACGADPARWIDDLRRVAAAAAEHPGAAVETSLQAPVAASARGAGTWWWRAVFAAGACVTFAAGLAVGSAFMSTSAAPTRHPLPPASAPSPAAGVAPFSGTPVPAPTARVADGADPAVARCAADARLVDKAPVLLGGVQIGALELKYSAWCGAGWARLYLYPGQPTMMGEVTVRSGDGRLSSFGDPLVKQVADYTNVVVPGPGRCLGAEAVVYSAGEPAVSASIPCESPTAG
jgi:transcriptional regulator with XRE-family HTH domain